MVEHELPKLDTWVRFPSPAQESAGPAMNPKQKPKLCPYCKKPAQWEDNPFRPFCSERCKMIDLGKWAAEDYRIPGEKADDEEIENEVTK